jgi:hypothetical protein
LISWTRQPATGTYPELASLPELPSRAEPSRDAVLVPEVPVYFDVFDLLRLDGESTMCLVLLLGEGSSCGVV